MTIIKGIFRIIEWPWKGPFCFICLTDDICSCRIFFRPCCGTFACHCSVEICFSCPCDRRTKGRNEQHTSSKTKGMLTSLFYRRLQNNTNTSISRKENRTKETTQGRQIIDTQTEKTSFTLEWRCCSPVGDSIISVYSSLNTTLCRCLSLVGDTILRSDKLHPLSGIASYEVTNYMWWSLSPVGNCLW